VKARRAARRLRPRTTLDRALVEQARALLRRPTSELPDAIGALLATLGAGIGADRVSLWEVDRSQGDLGPTCSWHRPGYGPTVSSISLREHPWLGEVVRSARTFSFTRISELPRDAVAERRLIVRHGPRSGAWIPVVVGGETVAVLMAGTIRRERALGPARLAALERGADALAAALVRRRAHEAGLGTEGRLGGVLEAAPDGILLVRKGGRIELANGRAATILHRTVRELVGAPLEELLAQDEDCAWRAGRSALDVLLASDEPLALAARRGDGAPVPVEVSVREVRVPGEPLFCCGLRDATAERRARDEAARLRNELAFVGRTAMLAEMAAGIAHELNQPLTAILSNAESAQRLLVSPRPADRAETGDALRDVVNDARRAADVLGRMRDMLRHRTVQRIPVEVAAMLASVARRFREEAVARSIKLAVDAPEGLPAVAGDPVQLEQVVMNLVLNAFDAMGPGPGKTRVVALRARAAGAVGVDVSVRDTGPGLEPEALARAFESFFTTKPSGLGMGLAISRTIVEAHGGRMLARNNPQGGATFEFHLPAATRATEAMRRRERA
jgi:two-component system sensor kinase FixL